MDPFSVREGRNKATSAKITPTRQAGASNLERSVTHGTVAPITYPQKTAITRPRIVPWDALLIRNMAASLPSAAGLIHVAPFLLANDSARPQLPGARRSSIGD